MDLLLQVDEKLFLFLNNLGCVHWDWLWLFITNKWAALPLYLFLLIILYKKTNRKQLVWVLVAIGILIACTDQTANLFKNSFERLRPCNFSFDDRSLVYCGRYGFFSAHAASAMAFAVFIGSILNPYYKHLRFLLIIWALLVGYSRIYVGVHYPGDVLIGYLVGLGYGIFFLQILKFFNTFDSYRKKQPLNIIKK